MVTMLGDVRGTDMEDLGTLEALVASLETEQLLPFSSQLSRFGNPLAMLPPGPPVPPAGMAVPGPRQPDSLLTGMAVPGLRQPDSMMTGMAVPGPRQPDSMLPGMAVPGPRPPDSMLTGMCSQSPQQPLPMPPQSPLHSPTAMNFPQQSHLQPPPAHQNHMSPRQLQHPAVQTNSNHAASSQHPYPNQAMSPRQQHLSYPNQARSPRQQQHPYPNQAISPRQQQHPTLSPRQHPQSTISPSQQQHMFPSQISPRQHQHPYPSPAISPRQSQLPGGGANGWPRGPSYPGQSMYGMSRPPMSTMDLLNLDDRDIKPEDFANLLSAAAGINLPQQAFNPSHSRMPYHQANSLQPGNRPEYPSPGARMPANHMYSGYPSQMRAPHMEFPGYPRHRPPMSGPSYPNQQSTRSPHPPGYPNQHARMNGYSSQRTARPSAYQGQRPSMNYPYGHPMHRPEGYHRPPTNGGRPTAVIRQPSAYLESMAAMQNQFLPNPAVNMLRTPTQMPRSPEPRGVINIVPLPSSPEPAVSSNDPSRTERSRRGRDDPNVIVIDSPTSGSTNQRTDRTRRRSNRDLGTIVIDSEAAGDDRSGGDGDDLILVGAQTRRGSDLPSTQAAGSEVTSTTSRSLAQQPAPSRDSAEFPSWVMGQIQSLLHSYQSDVNRASDSLQSTAEHNQTQTSTCLAEPISSSSHSHIPSSQTLSHHDSSSSAQNASSVSSAAIEVIGHTGIQKSNTSNQMKQGTVPSDSEVQEASRTTTSSDAPCRSPQPISIEPRKDNSQAVLTDTPDAVQQPMLSGSSASSMLQHMSQTRCPSSTPELLSATNRLQELARSSGMGQPTPQAEGIDAGSAQPLPPASPAVSASPAVPPTQSHPVPTCSTHHTAEDSTVQATPSGIPDGQGLSSNVPVSCESRAPVSLPSEQNIRMDSHITAQSASDSVPPDVTPVTPEVSHHSSSHSSDKPSEAPLINIKKEAQSRSSAARDKAHSVTENHDNNESQPQPQTTETVVDNASSHTQATTSSAQTVSPAVSQTSEQTLHSASKSLLAGDIDVSALVASVLQGSISSSARQNEDCSRSAAEVSRNHGASSVAPTPLETAAARNTASLQNGPSCPLPESTMPCRSQIAPSNQSSGEGEPTGSSGQQDRSASANPSVLVKLERSAMSEELKAVLAKCTDHSNNPVPVTQPTTSVSQSTSSAEGQTAATNENQPTSKCPPPLIQKPSHSVTSNGPGVSGDSRCPTPPPLIRRPALAGSLNHQSEPQNAAVGGPLSKDRTPTPPPLVRVGSKPPATLAAPAGLPVTQEQSTPAAPPTLRTGETELHTVTPSPLQNPDPATNRVCPPIHSTAYTAPQASSAAAVQNSAPAIRSQRVTSSDPAPHSQTMTNQRVPTAPPVFSQNSSLAQQQGMQYVPLLGSSNGQIMVGPPAMEASRVMLQDPSLRYSGMSAMQSHMQGGQLCMPTNMMTRSQLPNMLSNPHALSLHPLPQNPHARSMQPGPQNLHAQSMQPGPQNLHARSMLPGSQNPHARSMHPGPQNPHAPSMHPGLQNPHAAGMQPRPQNPNAQSMRPGPQNPHAPSMHPAPQNPHAPSMHPAPQNPHAPSMHQAPQNPHAPKMQPAPQNPHAPSMHRGPQNPHAPNMHPAPQNPHAPSMHPGLQNPHAPSMHPGPQNPHAPNMHPGSQNPRAPSMHPAPQNPHAPNMHPGSQNPHAPNMHPGPQNPHAPSRHPGPQNPQVTSMQPGPQNPHAPSRHPGPQNPQVTSMQPGPQNNHATSMQSGSQNPHAPSMQPGSQTANLVDNSQSANVLSGPAGNMMIGAPSGSLRAQHPPNLMRGTPVPNIIARPQVPAGPAIPEASNMMSGPQASNIVAAAAGVMMMPVIRSQHPRIKYTPGAPRPMSTPLPGPLPGRIPAPGPGPLPGRHPAPGPGVGHIMGPTTAHLDEPSPFLSPSHTPVDMSDEGMAYVDPTAFPAGDSDVCITSESQQPEYMCMPDIDIPDEPQIEAMTWDQECLSRRKRTARKSCYSDRHPPKRRKLSAKLMAKSEEFSILNREQQSIPWELRKMFLPFIPLEKVMLQGMVTVSACSYPVKPLANRRRWQIRHSKAQQKPASLSVKKKRPQRERKRRRKCTNYTETYSGSSGSDSSMYYYFSDDSHSDDEVVPSRRRARPKSFRDPLAGILSSSDSDAKGRRNRDSDYTATSDSSEDSDGSDAEHSSRHSSENSDCTYHSSASDSEGSQHSQTALKQMKRKRGTLVIESDEEPTAEVEANSAS